MLRVGEGAVGFAEGLAGPGRGDGEVDGRGCGEEEEKEEEYVHVDPPGGWVVQAAIAGAGGEGATGRRGMSIRKMA